MDVVVQPVCKLIVLSLDVVKRNSHGDSERKPLSSFWLILGFWRGNVTSLLELPYPVVLASVSPRRKELLSKLIPEFEVLGTGVDESTLTVADPWETAVQLAVAKAEAAFTLRPEQIVIGGDTVVAVPTEGSYEQLGKPSNEDEARLMLGKLSGREHMVITGVCVKWPGGQEEFSEATRVRFREIDSDEIDAYVEGGEPMDKAGAYAIQGGAAKFVESVEGSIDNVIGLPIEALGALLGKLFLKP